MLRTRPLSFQTLRSLQKCYTTKSNDVLSGIEVEEVPIYDVEPKHSVEELDKIRNKSRLAPHHRNVLFNQAPYTEPQEYYHDHVWYRRKIIGKYGLNAPMANPKYCWPTKEEIEEIKEYESVLYPKTIQEVWKEIEEKKKADALEIKQREEDIDKTVATFDKLRTALEAKIKKKEAEILAAKQKKEAMLEEIREHFGFYIDQKDERFQEMLEQKEKEDRKRKKEEKKQRKKEKMLAIANAKAEKKKAAEGEKTVKAETAGEMAVKAETAGEKTEAEITKDKNEKSD